MHFLTYCYHIIGLLIRLLFGLSSTEKQGETFLKSIEEEFGGKFETETFNKAKKFQSVQHHFINDTFTQLENRYTTKNEQENNKLYFVLASLYDDLIDENIVSHEVLNQMFLDPKNANPITFNEKVLIDTHLKLLNRVQDQEGYNNVLNNIQQAQWDSLLQTNTSLSVEEILAITKRKGGYSLLMCRYYINTTTYNSIDFCWYQLGALIQMTNDLYDIHKDTKDLIFTFANMQNSYSAIRQNYYDQINSFIQSVEQIPYNSYKKERLLIILSLIPAFGFIALDNLKKLQGENPNLLPINNYERSSLIIDMEKVKNILILIKNSYHISKQRNFV